MVPLPDADALAIIDDHAHGRWAAATARVYGTMRARLTEQGLGEAWAYVVGWLGPTRATATPTPGALATSPSPTHRWRVEAGDFVARITFRDDRTIAGLYILNLDTAGGVDGWAAT